MAFFSSQGWGAAAMTPSACARALPAMLRTSDRPAQEVQQRAEAAPGRQCRPVSKGPCCHMAARMQLQALAAGSDTSFSICMQRSEMDI